MGVINNESDKQIGNAVKHLADHHQRADYRDIHAQVICAEQGHITQNNGIDGRERNISGLPCKKLSGRQCIRILCLSFLSHLVPFLLNNELLVSL